MLHTSVYRKVTHSGRYLNALSNHPHNLKLGITLGLLHRANVLCSDVGRVDQEIKRIQQDMVNNGYPSNVVGRKPRPKRPKRDIKKPAALVHIPYYKGTSEKIRRIGNKFNIQTSFSSRNTLRSQIVNTKPMDMIQRTKECVYNIPCGECDFSYIGETGRPLDIRLKEHIRNVTRGDGSPTPSKVVEHAWDFVHKFNWTDARILTKEPHWKKRKIKEAAYIMLTKNCLSQVSANLPQMWLPLLENSF